MVKNLSCKAGDEGSISGQGTKIPRAAGKLSLHAETTRPALWSLQAVAMIRCSQICFKKERNHR